MNEAGEVAGASLLFNPPDNPALKPMKQDFAKWKALLHVRAAHT